MNRGWILGALIGCLCMAACETSESGTEEREPVYPEFPNLGVTPYVVNHSNPMKNDTVPFEAPTEIKQLWATAGDYAVWNACTGGPEGNIYCPGYQGEMPRSQGKCNLLALDYKTGNLLWTDAKANGGECLLDEQSFPNSPFIDNEGNVYTGDSKRVISYTANGDRRWEKPYPAELSTMSGSGLPNPPFNYNMLTTGELITTTLGDAFVLVMDKDTGELLSEPFDIPAQKIPGGIDIPRPQGMWLKFGGPDGADASWNSSFGDLQNENDNDTTVDQHTNLMFAVSAAEAPNDLCETPEDDPGTPCGDGKLWVLRYDPDAPGEQKISVVFTVRFAGPGGSTTSPGVSWDGQFVVIGNNTQDMVVVDIPGCAAEFEGTPGTEENSYHECDKFATLKLPNNLMASPTVTKDNIVIALAQRQGVYGVQISRDPDDGSVQLEHLYTYGPFDKDGNPTNNMPADCPAEGCVGDEIRVAVSVITAFDNVAYTPYVTLRITGMAPDAGELPPNFGFQGTVRAAWAAFDPKTGEELSILTFDEGAGEGTVMSVAGDGETLITCDFQFLTQLWQDRLKPIEEQLDAGVRAFVAANPEMAITGDRLVFANGYAPALNYLYFKSTDERIDLPKEGTALDPARHNADLHLFNPKTGEKQYIQLPGENWTHYAPFGSEPIAVYRDLDGSEGPCRLAWMTEDEIGALCLGEALSLSLDEASEARLGFSFSVSPARHLCALFEGQTEAGMAGKFFSASGASRSKDCIIPEDESDSVPQESDGTDDPRLAVR